MRCVSLVFDSAAAYGRIERCSSDACDDYGLCERHRSQFSRQPSKYETSALRRAGIERGDLTAEFWEARGGNDRLPRFDVPKTIVTVDLLRPDARRMLRELAQDLLTSYQKFASNSDSFIDPDLERRAKALGLDTEAWLQ